MTTVPTPEMLWQPSVEFVANSNLTGYKNFLNKNFGLTFNGYDDLWHWSIVNIEDFWQSILVFFKVEYDGTYESVLRGSVPGMRWFEGIRLNYTEHIFRNKTNDRPAIIAKTESTEIQEISWQELERKVSSFQQYLINIGIKEGDRVAAYLPNIPEALIAFYAVNSLGAIWTSTSPDFGTQSVIDRVAQIKPTVLITVESYQYGGKSFTKNEVVQQILKAIPDIQNLVVVGEAKDLLQVDNATSITWDDTMKNEPAPLLFTRVEFNQPIWVLYSSGTTGKPKAITHSHGGVLLEHLKYLSLHNNVKSADRCFWYTTIGWMMWNYIQASLLCGGTVVLYDGSPGYPDMDVLWQLAEKVKINHFGISAGYIIANMKAGTNPGNDFDLSPLVSIGSTGSPLPPEGFKWIYKKVKKDIWVASISGGSDVCSAFVGGNPWWPVYEGEIQCRALGCALAAYNEEGEPVLEKMAEMVITQPMPSMPIYFWGDNGNKKYKESYYEHYKGVWRHGDWTEVTARGGVIIYGRSDATLNRGGVRIGTAEIYRAVDSIPAVADSLVVYVEKEGSGTMPLFVKIAPGYSLSQELISKIKTTIREAYSPRHVPDKVFEVHDIPYTISGKKMETPVKKILQGADIDTVANLDAMRNPEALNDFIDLISQV